MFFQTKKKRIQKYLDGKASAMAAFDELLREYLDDTLRQKLNGFGISKAEIHIDWLDDYKCIGIQGQLGGGNIDIQIEETQFSIAFDQDEPDEGQAYDLEAASQVYAVLKDFVNRPSPLAETKE